MSVIIPFIRKYKVAAAASLAMMLMELAVELSQPLLISKIIDEGIRQRDAGTVWMWGGVLLASAAVAFAAGILSSFFAAHTSQGFAFDLRDKLYSRIQRFSYETFSRFATSSLITRLTGDVGQLQDTLFMSLRFMTRIPLVVIGSVVMALVVHAGLGVWLALTVPLLLGFLYLSMRMAAHRFKAVQERLDSVNGVIQENLTGIALIRAFVRTGHEIARFGEASLGLMRSSVRALKLTETSAPILMLMMNGAVILVLWFGRVQIEVGSATLGETVAVVNYCLRTIGALSALSGIVVTYSKARASVQRIREVMEAEEGSGENRADLSGLSAASLTSAEDIRVESEAGQGAVVFEHVSFCYPGSDIPILSDISFRVRPGERVAVMGATGSGKSSLVALIPRLYEPSAGRVLVNGEDVRSMDESRLRGMIGYAPQEALLFSGTIRENIAWGKPDASPEEIGRAAEAAQIAETIRSLPEGYETRLGQRGVNLSGGQKQRLGIARALVRRPAILILDDSTSALDAVTEGRLLKALESLSCTTFLITQKISSTRSCDRILLLEDGRLEAEGTHDDLMKQSALYRTIWESQAPAPAAGEEARHAQGTD
ncbi:ABC transporter ATP-binding protein [Paenibacillus spiritus]|uniref:ABC transporter ATP-binding protein n=1 Tax=Paenibacillus spiritus TaxID=2496557 RepID=A0A5J5GIC8_9BACL|nr:ABC transporter ATP-binding protein [Paenibacillus spiritus]KAA9007453.1 ABC transporter ATP-binding protein [Paenibacillus spiritus]